MYRTRTKTSERGIFQVSGVRDDWLNFDGGWHVENSPFRFRSTLNELRESDIRSKTWIIKSLIPCSELWNFPFLRDISNFSNNSAHNSFRVFPRLLVTGEKETGNSQRRKLMSKLIRIENWFHHRFFPLFAHFSLLSACRRSAFSVDPRFFLRRYLRDSWRQLEGIRKFSHHINSLMLYHFHDIHSLNILSKCLMFNSKNICDVANLKWENIASNTFYIMNFPLEKLR